MSLCDNCVHRDVCGTEDAREKIGKASPFLYVCDDFIDKSILSVPKREKGMTNGEVIQNIYGVMVLTVKDGKVWVEKMYFPFDEVWWNAPYKKEVSE